MSIDTNTPTQTFEFDRRINDGGTFSLSNAVHQAIGAASMCWEHVDRAGVFESDRAAEIAAALLAEIESQQAAHVGRP